MTAATKKAIADANKLLEGTGVAPIKATVAAKKAANKADKKAAKAPKPAPKAAKPARAAQDSVTATMVRGKRDWKTREIDTTWMPAAKGGVRFEEENDKGRSPHFMTQADFADIGSPDKVRVTVKAL